MILIGSKQVAPLKETTAVLEGNSIHSVDVYSKVAKVSQKVLYSWIFAMARAVVERSAPTAMGSIYK